ncbi:unnamed protein product [marine sediment metagenome]|uniref:Cohesin domain-containing protein n=1 Tax=marine sediment metagenome TaxID=412755 RepID=X0T1I5_9ZZZZ
MKKNILYVFLISLFFFLFSPFSLLPVLAQNALFSLKSNTVNLELNEAFIVQAFVNTFEEEVNTVHLELEYSSQHLFLKEISFTDSVFPNIVEKDTSMSNTIKLTAFSITPYKGNNGLVASLKFRSKNTGRANIEILPSSKIHLADGSGTDTFNYQTSQKNFQIIISQVGDTSSPSPSPAVSPTISDQDSEPGLEPSIGETIKELFTKPVDFIKEKLLPKAKITPTDEEKDRIYFPENYDQVVDYTQNRQTTFKRFINQFKSIGKILGKTGSKLLVLFFLIVFAFLAVIVFIKVKEKRKNNQPEKTNEH